MHNTALSDDMSLALHVFV